LIPSDVTTRISSAGVALIVSGDPSGKGLALLDPYALVFYGWGARGGFPMKELSAYAAWQERMLKRPTVRKTVESEQNVSTS
jgi:hypothetical protein